MTVSRKILIGVLAFALFLLLLNFGLNFWISSHLPKIINDENDSAYHITFKKLEVSLINSTILAEEVVVIPKSALKDTLSKTGIYAQVKTVKISHYKIWNILFGHKIEAKSITFTKPEIVLYQETEDTKNVRSQVMDPFRKIIVVSDVFINNGDLKIIYTKTNKAILSVSNIALEMDGILITDSTLGEKIPFSFSNYTLSCDSLYFRPNPFYHITTNSITTTATHLEVKNFALIPEYSRAEFVRKIPKEKDLFTVNAAHLTIKNMAWGYKKDLFFFNSGSITLDSVFANIYRGKMPPDDLSKKPLYNKLLREIPFDLNIDTLAIQNSTLEYEEEKTAENGAGLLSFQKFNLTANHISSGFQKTKIPDVTIKINSQFMNTSPLTINWRLNVLDQTDGFTIQGKILNFPVEKLTPFIKPYLNVTAKGILDQVRFNFTGNDKSIKGDFAMDYEDLKITVYRKNERKKKNKFLSSIAGLFVKKDSEEKLKKTEVKVERIPEKSFFNFLWRAVAEGLKKTLT